MDYFGGGKRLCRSLHRRLVEGYMRSRFLTIWEVRAIAFFHIQVLGLAVALVMYWIITSKSLRICANCFTQVLEA